MNRADSKRLSDLRDRHELAELEILTKSPDELTESFDPTTLTIGQILIFADLMSALASVREAQEKAQRAEVSKALVQSLLSRANEQTDEPASPSPFASPARSETRSGFGYGRGAYGGSRDSDPFGDDDSARSEEAVSALREALNRQTVETVNGPVRMDDIPRGADGYPLPEWVEANCNCSEHTRQRQEAADRARGGFREEYPGDAPGFGQYL